MKNYKYFLKKFVYCKKNLWKMVLMNFIIAIISCSSLLLPYFSKIIVNAITGYQDINEVSKYLILFLGINFCILLFNFTKHYIY